MDSSTAYSLEEMLDLVCQDGLIDSYETGGSRITFYQRGDVFSLSTDSAEDFLQRIVRAMNLDRHALPEMQETAV